MRRSSRAPSNSNVSCGAQTSLAPSPSADVGHDPRRRALGAVDLLGRLGREGRLGAGVERDVDVEPVAPGDSAPDIDQHGLARPHAREFHAQAARLIEVGELRHPSMRGKSRAQPRGDVRLLRLAALAVIAFKHADRAVRLSKPEASMTAGIFALVLAAALLHAGWNALVKQADDPFLGMAAVCLWGGLFAAAVFVALPPPPAAAWPYIGASIALHTIYFWLVGLVYRHADLSTAYPIMRGSAPLITFVLAAVGLREFPGLGGLCGVLLLAGGVVALSLTSGREALAKSLPLALTIALSISLYTVIDAEGARLTGEGAAGAFAYNGASDAGTGLVLTPIAALWRGPGFFSEVAKRWQKGLAGGAAAFFGYGLVVYATTQAPIALVAALRESSVLFAAVIGVVAFGEPIGAHQGRRGRADHGRHRLDTAGLTGLPARQGQIRGKFARRCVRQSTNSTSPAPYKRRQAMIDAAFYTPHNDAADAARMLTRIGMVALAIGVPASAGLGGYAMSIMFAIGVALLFAAEALYPAPGVERRFRDLRFSLLALAVLGFVAWAAASLSWTPFPNFGLRRIGIAASHRRSGFRRHPRGAPPHSRGRPLPFPDRRRGGDGDDAGPRDREA